MNCQRCGKPLAEGTPTCPFCGQSQMSFCCPRCQAPISANTTLCPSCGLQMQPYTPNGTPAPQQQTRKSGVPIGLIIGLIVAGILGMLAAAIVVIFLLAGRITKKAEEEQPTEPPTAVAETAVTAQNTYQPDTEAHISLDQNENPEDYVPHGALIRTKAEKADIVGDWEGTFTFTALSGDAFGAAEQTSQLVGAEMPFALTLDEDGAWTLYMSAFDDLIIDETDFEPLDPANDEEASAHLWKGPENGRFTILPPMLEEDAYGESGILTLTGAVADDADGILLSGVMTMELHLSDGNGYLRGNWVVRPEGSAVNTASTTDSSEETDPPLNTAGVEKPVPGDFVWFENFTSVPDGVRYLDLGEYFGSWKGMIIYDETVRSLLNVQIEAGQHDIGVLLDWHQIWYNGEAPVPDDSEDLALSGYNWGDGIRAEGNGTLELTDFYEYNGKQYAVGTYQLSNGTTAAVALVR